MEFLIIISSFLYNIMSHLLPKQFFNLYSCYELRSKVIGEIKTKGKRKRREEDLKGRNLKKVERKRKNELSAL